MRRRLEFRMACVIAVSFAGMHSARAGEIKTGWQAEWNKTVEAAKVFINWLLSREGQMTVQKIVGRDSLRSDIPKNGLPLKERRVQDVPYLDLETPDRIDMEPVVKAFEEALAQAGKK